MKPFAASAFAVAKMSFVVKARCWMPEPKVSEMKRPATVLRFSAPFMVMRIEPSAFATTWLRTRPDGSTISTIGVFSAWKIAV